MMENVVEQNGMHFLISNFPVLSIGVTKNIIQFGEKEQPARHPVL